MKDIFNPETLDELLARIEKLRPESAPHWGKMDAAQMFAHCSLVFEYNNGERHYRVNPLLKFLLRGMMRRTIVGPKPYRPNSPTAPYFKVVDKKAFRDEKARLVQRVTAYSKAGPQAARKREHAWLGKLSAEEWSTAMYKHLDHHLNQFGV